MGFGGLEQGELPGGATGMTPVVAIVPFSGKSRRTNQCEVGGHTQLSPAGRSSEDARKKGEHGGGRELGACGQ